MNTSIRHSQFQNISLHVPKFGENRFRDFEKSVDGKNDTLECGPMPNVMAAQTNIGGAVCESSVIPFLVSRRKVWRRRCSNEGKTRNPMKFAGVPQTDKPISAVSGPKFTIL